MISKLVIRVCLLLLIICLQCCRAEDTIDAVNIPDENNTMLASELSYMHYVNLQATISGMGVGSLAGAQVGLICYINFLGMTVYPGSGTLSNVGRLVMDITYPFPISGCAAKVSLVTSKYALLQDKEGNEPHYSEGGWGNAQSLGGFNFEINMNFVLGLDTYWSSLVGMWVTMQGISNYVDSLGLTRPVVTNVVYPAPSTVFNPVNSNLQIASEDNTNLITVAHKWGLWLISKMAGKSITTSVAAYNLCNTVTDSFDALAMGYSVAFAAMYIYSNTASPDISQMKGVILSGNNLEIVDCAALSSTNIPGRIAAAMWDLYDTNNDCNGGTNTVGRSNFCDGNSANTLSRVSILNGPIVGTTYPSASTSVDNYRARLIGSLPSSSVLASTYVFMYNWQTTGNIVVQNSVIKSAMNLTIFTASGDVITNHLETTPPTSSRTTPLIVNQIITGIIVSVGANQCSNGKVYIPDVALVSSETLSNAISSVTMPGSYLRLTKSGSYINMNGYNSV